MAEQQQGSGNLPDPFDRQLATLHGLPDVIKSAVSTIRTVPPFGIGGSQVFVVQTYRQKERGDLIFIEVVGGETMRLVVPPQVANVIARQRESLTQKSRSKAAKAVAAERAAQGIVPFVRKRKGA